MEQQTYYQDIITALTSLYVNDRELLTKHTSEQTLSFRIGHYLAQLLDNPSQGRYVDCEYQRDKNRKDGLKRSPSQVNSRSYMRIDIIYHDRGRTENLGNYFAIEVKMKDNIQNDKVKIKRLLSVYNFDEGYCIYNISQTGFTLIDVRAKNLLEPITYVFDSEAKMLKRGETK